MGDLLKLRHYIIAQNIANGFEYEPTLAVDFDATIFREVEYPEIGEPFEGVAQALQELGKYFKIRIYSCRTNGLNAVEAESNRKMIEDALDKYGIYYDDIVMWHEGKPHADFYIDDKGLRFEGDWEKVVKYLTGEGI